MNAKELRAVANNLATVRNIPIAKVKTRGEFRALCRLLGVTLKDQS